MSNKNYLQVEVEADILNTATRNKDTLPITVHVCHICAGQWEDLHVAAMMRAIEYYDDGIRLMRVEETNRGDSSHRKRGGEKLKCRQGTGTERANTLSMPKAAAI
jgi:hypothetical protein